MNTAEALEEAMQKIDDGERLKQSFESRYLAEVQRRKMLEAALINEQDSEGN